MLLGVDWQEGKPYWPKIRWRGTRKESGEVEYHEWKENDFAHWIGAEDGAVPNKQSHMNCREAVFCSAYVAKLVSRPWLRLLHHKMANAKPQDMLMSLWDKPNNNFVCIAIDGLSA